MANPPEKRYIDVPERWREGGDEHRMEATEALRRAAHGNDMTVMRSALDAGADPNAANKHNGWTALHEGAFNGEVVRLLLDNGADPNVRDIAGETPLHFAARSPHDTSTETLLQGGANPSITDAKGATPLIGVTNAKNVELLLDYGADVNARDAKGDTALHVDARWRRSNTEVTERLAQRGADLDARNDKGDTPLHVAAARDNRNHVDALLNHGADHGATNARGQTPLDLIKRGPKIPAVERLQSVESVDAEQIDAPRKQRVRV
ncbi:ankyrin repeat domain-containing protein [Burkholderia vietnamiensis]|uniref:ankyrin repeat domain-containing protein n=1 Tax=Burkholderia vietnamiensis TaxID=60552 RepID=UPI001CF36297|nr:ankyrin repeat domain-containing protein [Burkholderia vietnamiensis]MCA8448897.1 ankyrin repeat domain-containing protein [Burkholderia vietnamiensis]